ncbi:MAG: radical SAM protein [Candidatus Velamenicoccus archaeovorus]
MHIAHISSSLYHPCFWELVRRQKIRHQITYISLETSVDSDGQTTLHSRTDLRHIHIRCSPDNNIVYDERLRLALDNALKADPPDIVHVHLFSGTKLRPILTTAASLGARIVVTLHDHSLFCAGGRFHDGRKICRKTNPEACSCPDAQRLAAYNHMPLSEFNAARRGHIRQIIDMCDAIICPSQIQKEILAPLVADPDKIVCLPYGVHMRRRPRARRQDKEPVFGFLGIWTPLKGSDTIEYLIKRNGGIRMLLGLWTKGAPQKNLRQLENIGNRPDIEIIENIPYAELPEKFYSKIDYLLVPSVWDETGPMSLLESLYQKIPVIIPRQPSLLEKTIPGRNAFVYSSLAQLNHIIGKIRRGRARLKPPFRARVQDIHSYAAEVEAIYRHILDKEPRTLFFRVGYRCNNRCIFCVTGDNKPGTFTSLEILTKALAAYRRSYDQLVFSGGEPTAREDFFSLMESAFRLGYKIQIQTNGRLMAKKEFVKRLAAYHPVIYTHLQDYKARAHDVTTNVPGSFWETVAGIRNALAVSRGLYVKIMITRANYRHLQETAKFLKRLGVKGIWFVFLTPHGFARTYFDKVVPTYTQVSPYLKRALQWARKEKNLEIVLEGFPYCYVPRPWRNNLLEGPRLSGRRQLCLHPAEKGRDFRISPTHERLKDKTKGPRCQRCAYHQRCEGVYRTYAQHHGFDEFKPIGNDPKKTQDR